jgi:hypothetical protein
MNSPWLGVVLIALGLVAIVVFDWLKIPQGASALAVLTLGIAILQGVSHQNTSKELTNTTNELVTLRKSMRPPSLVDEFEKVSSIEGPKEKNLSVPVIRESGDPDKLRGK